MVRRSPVGGDGTKVPPVVGRVLGQAGHSLDPATRSAMEGAFGQDFSRVRVHTGPVAAESARAAGARAYTFGNDIVFGGGRYAPGTLEGDRLLAHELTHVVQQAGRGRVQGSALRLGEPGDHAEREAERVAADMVNAPGRMGERARITADATPAIRRQPDSDRPVPSDADGRQTAGIIPLKDSAFESKQFRAQIDEGLKRHLDQRFSVNEDERPYREDVHDPSLGIAKTERILEYMKGAEELRKEWAAMTPEERRAGLESLANATLKKEGLPTIKVVEGESSFGNTKKEWAIYIPGRICQKDNPSEFKFSVAVATLYHEARHSEQWFRAIRYALSEKKTVLAAPPEVIKMARQSLQGAPIAKGSAEYRFAKAMHDSVIGPGSEHREQVLRALAKPHPDSVFTQYQRLPEESEAFLTMERVYRLWESKDKPAPLNRRHGLRLVPPPPPTTGIPQPAEFEFPR